MRVCFQARGGLLSYALAMCMHVPGLISKVSLVFRTGLPDDGRTIGVKPTLARIYECMLRRTCIQILLGQED